MRRIPALLLVFAAAFTVFFIGPPFLGFSLPLYPLMKTGDALDILTPLVLLPLYWLLFAASRPTTVSVRAMVIFIALAGLWAMGQGMHLSANSILHQLSGMEGSDIYSLTYFYDEILSHYLWYIGIMGMSAFLVYHEWQASLPEPTKLWPVLLAGLVYGFSFYLVVTEGGTAPVGITFAVLTAIFGVVWGRKHLSEKPLLTFFFTAYAFSLGLFAIWAVIWGGLPQFSQVGWL